MTKSKHLLLSMLSLYLSLYILPVNAISIKVGERYTCNLGYISHLKGCVWTTSDYHAMDFVNAPTNTTTEVEVIALAKPTYATPVTIHCQYYYYDLDPVTGRYIYERSGYKDWNFFIKDDGVQNISVYPQSLSLSVGEGYQLSASVAPVTWSSSNYDVANVTSFGYVTALNPGSANIIAAATSGQTASCIVTVSSSSTPQPSVGIVIIETVNGERIEYELNSSPRITPIGSVVKLVTDKATVEFEANKVAKVYIADSPTDINLLNVAEGNYVMKKDVVRFIGYSPSEPIIIYTVDGRLVSHNITDSNGNLTLFLQDLSSGTYIIKTRQQSIKILRR